MVKFIVVIIMVIWVVFSTLFYEDYSGQSHWIKCLCMPNAWFFSPFVLLSLSPCQMCVTALIFLRWKSSVCLRSSYLIISWELIQYMAMTTTTGSTRLSSHPTSTSTWPLNRSRRPSNTSVSTDPLALILLLYFSRFNSLFSCLSFLTLMKLSFPLTIFSSKPLKSLY